MAGSEATSECRELDSAIINTTPSLAHHSMAGVLVDKIALVELHGSRIRLVPPSQETDERACAILNDPITMRYLGNMVRVLSPSRCHRELSLSLARYLDP